MTVRRLIGPMLAFGWFAGGGLPTFALPPNPDLPNWMDRKNNCYNYATNVPTDGDKAQPGYGAGQKWLDGWGAGGGTAAQWCDKVRAKAQRDGLVHIPWAQGQPIPNAPSGYNLVALGALAGTKGGPGSGDYHWWRKNGDGSWSHKRGRTKAKTTFTNKHGTADPSDDTEDPITDPRDPAQTDGYTLCGFMGVPKNPPPTVSSIPPPPNPPPHIIPTEVQTEDLIHSGWIDEPVHWTGANLDLLRSHLPDFTPSNQVPDPMWTGVHAGESAGFGITPGSAVPDFPPFMRVFRGVVAVYLDPQGMQILYYNDNNGLGQFLIESVPIPTVSEWGLIILALCVLTVASVVIRLRRRPALA